MLLLNLNKLGQMFPRQPEKTPLYIQEQLRRDHPSTAKRKKHLLLPELGKEV
jgi:hypothetical protein